MRRTLAILFACLIGAGLWLFHQERKSHAPPRPTGPFPGLLGSLADLQSHLWWLDDVNQEIDGKPPLYYAANMPVLLSCVRRLLQRGANPNAKAPWGGTPLHTAAMHGNTEIVKVLLDHGASVTIRNDAGQTSLHVGAPHPKVVELLLTHAANPGARDNGGSTPLHSATQDSAKLLIEKGADVNAVDDQGYTPLHTSILIRDYVAHATVKVLLAHRAEVNVRDQRGKTPLAYAKSKSLTSVVELLQDHGATE